MKKLCLHQSICVMIYLQGGICIHCMPTREHSRYGILPSGHSHHGILPKRHLHSLHTQAGIRIHCIPARSICIMACTNGTCASWHIPKRTFASWHAPWEHSHHGMLPRRHLHHDIPTRSVYIMTCPLEGICTTRHFASPSL